MIQVYPTDALNPVSDIYISGCNEPYPVDQYTAQAFNRGGTDYVLILHDTLGVFNDVTREWRGSVAFAQWNQFVDENDAQLGNDLNSTIAALNAMLKSV